MVTDKIQKLLQYQKQMAKLEKELSRYNSKLLALPAKHGFKSMDAFIDALRAAQGSGKSRAASAAKVGAAAGRKPRAKITAETKAKVKALVGEGKTGGQIAKALNISLPSVQNIKKELGLVKKRG
jgi:hypothetical protein